MTGPEHYREAERLLEDAVIRGFDDRDYAGDRPSTSDHLAPDCEGIGNLAAAQVHATLALAAATMDSVLINDQQAHSPEWVEVTS